MNLDETINNELLIAAQNQKVIDTHLVFDDCTIEELYCDDTDVIAEQLNNYQFRAIYHKQIADWLTELKQLRSEDDLK